MRSAMWATVLFAPLAFAPSLARAAEVDAQFVFGFTKGADVGEPGRQSRGFVWEPPKAALKDVWMRVWVLGC
jgi:hypothetical protein